MEAKFSPPGFQHGFRPVFGSYPPPRENMEAEFSPPGFQHDFPVFGSYPPPRENMEAEFSPPGFQHDFPVPCSYPSPLENMEAEFPPPGRDPGWLSYPPPGPPEGDLDRPQCCIYRVPKAMRKVNKEAYTPQIISIGPLHYGEEELGDMEKLKRSYAEAFFKRTTVEKCEQVLTFIKDNEQQIQNHYSESCRLTSEEYVKMCFYDAIFIIELLIRNFEKYGEDGSDFLLRTPAQKIPLKLDLQLLENQLPYFLLEELYKLVASNPPFIELCFKFFADQMFDSLPDRTEFKHFTDLRRSALVKSYRGQEFDYHEYPEFDLPCAARLHDSGVKFKAVPGTDQGLLGIKFEVDELKIPHLEVYDGTETILGNIMALEQCYYPYDTPVCDYVKLLEFLIDTKTDVDLLVKEGIISNRLGKKEALVSFFNKLCSHVSINNLYYNEIQKALKAHYDVPCNSRVATLKVCISETGGELQQLLRLV